MNGGWRVLKTRDFGSLWVGQVVSQVGDGLNKVALLWFVYELTGSALKMATIGLLQTIPPLVFGPLIGVYLDRLPKKAVMIWVDLIRAVMIMLIPLCDALNLLTLERLYLLVFLISIVSTVFGPALSSAVPLIVRRDQLTSANALIQSSANIGILLGPAISGLGIALIGSQNVLYVDAATFLFAVLCLLPVRFREVQCIAGHSGDAAPAVVQELLQGVRFVKHRTVFPLMITAALYNLAASAFVFLLPVVAKDVLQIGPVRLGWLWSLLGVGMLAASIWLARLEQGNFRDRLRIITRAMTVGGLAVGSLGLQHTLLLSAGLILVIGGSTALFTPIVWAMLQEMTPAHLLGRMFTTFNTGSMASAMAGMAGFSWATDAVGPAATLVAIGVTLLLTAAVVSQFSRMSRAVQLAPIST